MTPRRRIKTFDTLKQRARLKAKLRGHELNRFKSYGYPREAVVYCKRCKRELHLSSTMMPIHSGELGLMVGRQLGQKCKRVKP